MEAFSIRPARAEEQAFIREVIQSEAYLDPTDLRWQNFLIAETAEGEFAGMGQIRRTRRCNELGSLYVREPYRKSGIGGRLIEALIAGEPGEIHLECRTNMAPYYERFGFVQIPIHQAPPPLLYKAAIGAFLGIFFGVRAAVMRLQR